MTTVVVSLQRPGPDGLRPASGILEWSPTRRHPAGAAVVLPDPLPVEVVAGAATLEVEPSPADGSWVWRVVERVPGGARRPRYVLVPDVASVPYVELVEVDPLTLAPAGDPDPVWVAALDALDDRVDALEAGGPGGGLTMPLELIDLDTAATTPTYQAGRLWWDAVEHTVNVASGIDGVVLQVGQEMHLRARNATGAPIANGALVYVSGSTGDRATISLATTGTGVVGMTTMEIPHGEDGVVTVYGIVRELDTSMLTAGAQVYAGATPGQLATSGTLPVGVVLRSHATQGMILVRVEPVGGGVDTAELDAAVAAAEDARDAAAASATQAATSASTASTSAMSASGYATAAGTAADDAAIAAGAASGYASTASAAAGQASTSATAAAGSASDANASASAAAGSATAAAGSSSTAAGHATAAAGSATAASTSAGEAADSATAAGASAGESATSATAAASSATAAGSSASTASAAATTAQGHASAASTSAGQAASSATAAAGSATAASGSASAASTSATNAASSATAASGSASTAAGHATAAGTARTGAETARDEAEAALAAMPPAPWSGTQAAYDALGTYDPARLYVILPA